MVTTPKNVWRCARQGVLHRERSEQQAYVAYVRFRKLAHARGEKPGMSPVVKKNACGIWVKNALYARGEEFLPLAGMEGQRDLSPALRDGDYPQKRLAV